MVFTYIEIGDGLCIATTLSFGLLSGLSDQVIRRFRIIIIRNRGEYGGS